MRRIAVIIPEWLDTNSPVLSSKMSNLTRIAEQGTVRRLSQLLPVETPEARWLGLRPDRAELRQGPLTIAALGADPPPRSLHFHLSVLSLQDDGSVHPPEPGPSEEEVRIIVESARRLDTRSITLVPGSGVDHGLVWEELGEMKTTPAAELIGHLMGPFLPEGDREPTLRRFIDDSVNLLGELELNRRRVDEGLHALNLLWPWGHGERKPVPNLALMRAAPATIISSSMRLAGLTRLAGYRHTDRHWLGEGLRTRFAVAGQRLMSEDSSVLLLDAISEFRSQEMLEEAEFVSRQIDGELLGTLVNTNLEERLRLLIVVPSSKGVGLAMEFDSKNPKSNIVPFDERSLDDRHVGVVDVEDAISDLLSPEV